MRAAVAVVAVALALPASAADSNGRIVFGFGAGGGADYSQYVLFFRSKDGEHSDYATYFQSNWLFKSKRDFDDASENGIVKVLSLAPGEWEIYSFNLVEPGDTLSPEEEFSIPFTDKAGAVTYIGDFMAMDVARPAMDGSSIVFVVSDKHARDMALASQKDKTLSDAIIAIPDATAAHSPFFSSAPASPVNGATLP